MKTTIYLSLLLFIIVTSCSQTEKNYVARAKLHSLSEAEIYNKDMVYDVIFDARELNADSVKNLSRQLFLKGIDLYKNKKDLTGAIKLFKQSILIFPDAKTYYEMGNAMLEARASAESIREAEKAYEVAEHLDFKPLGILYYKIASIRNLLNATDKNMGYNETIYQLEKAFQNGFSDTNMLKNDRNFSSLLASKEFRVMLLKWKSEKNSNPESLFDIYKSSFQEYKQPFAITFENLMNENDRQSISYEFASFIPEMQNVSFGRDVSHDFFYVAKVAETPVYTALIYSSISFWEQYMQPIHTKLVTYDHEGKIIASKLFAGQFSAEKVKIGKISNNEITLQDYKRIWKFPFDKVSFEENVVDRYELIATATYKLSDTGEILELSVPANYSDSVVLAKN
jgi:hypothetical protein